MISLETFLREMSVLWLWGHVHLWTLVLKICGAWDAPEGAHLPKGGENVRTVPPEEIINWFPLMFHRSSGQAFKGGHGPTAIDIVEDGSSGMSTNKSIDFLGDKLSFWSKIPPLQCMCCLSQEKGRTAKVSQVLEWSL